MPLISFCIPTFNRAYYVRRALQHIASQTPFQTTDDVEIVVSDNASTDRTPEIVAPFLAAYPGKIRYIRHAAPGVGEKNFEAALRAGSGEFLKLMNDTVLMKDGTVADMLAFVRRHRQDRPVLFFSNRPSDAYAWCENLDAFVRHASYMATWIGAFGIWREDLAGLGDFSRYAHGHLIQTDVLLRLLAGGRPAACYAGEFADMLRAEKKRGYNAAEIFGRNYFALLGAYAQAGLLSAATYAAERKKTLYGQIIPQYFDFKKRNLLQKTGFVRHLSACYGDAFFYAALPVIGYQGLVFFLKRKTRSHAHAMRKLWRTYNRRNTVTFANFDRVTEADIAKTMVGFGSMGTLDVAFSADPDERLILGDNVRLEPRARFIFTDAGGDGPDIPAGGRRDIVVEDGVSIGADSRIFAGVTIGAGAFIAAHSLVTRDVPPGADAGG